MKVVGVDVICRDVWGGWEVVVRLVLGCGEGWRVRIWGGAI